MKSHEGKENEFDFDIQFYEAILENNPKFVQALTILGDLYTKKGWYEKGLAIDKRLSQLRPYDPFVLYNLACSYSLLNKIDQAFAVVKMAIASGYDNFDYLKKDPDLANLFQDQRFQEYLRQLQP